MPFLRHHLCLCCVHSLGNHECRWRGCWDLTGWGRGAGCLEWRLIQDLRHKHWDLHHFCDVFLFVVKPGISDQASFLTPRSQWTGFVRRNYLHAMKVVIVTLEMIVCDLHEFFLPFDTKFIPLEYFFFSKTFWSFFHIKYLLFFEKQNTTLFFLFAILSCAMMQSRLPRALLVGKKVTSPCFFYSDLSKFQGIVSSN
jgi:hypothetical protein